VAIRTSFDQFVFAQLLLVGPRRETTLGKIRCVYALLQGLLSVLS